MSAVPTAPPRVDLRAVFTLAAPLMLTNAVQAVLNLTDTWFLGRLSTEAVAAIGVVYWLMICAVLVLGGVVLVVQTFVAQALGAGRPEDAGRTAWAGLWASVGTLPLFLLLAGAGPLLLAPLSLDAQIERLALEYWQPRMWGSALGLAAWSLSGFYTGIGATRITLLIAVVTTLTNIPANELLIFRADLGIAGAAWGTNVAQLAGLLTGLAVLLAPEHAARFGTRTGWQLDLARIARLLRVGMPVGIMYGADLVGVALMQMMVVTLGSAGGAATQLVFMLTSLAYLPALGIASAGTTLVGQSIGAGDRAWALRLGTVSIALCVGFMALVAVLMLAFGGAIVPLFLQSKDAAASATIATALVILWPAAAYQAFDGLYFGASSALRGAGDTRVPAVTALLLSWGLFVPLAHTLVFDADTAWIKGLPQAGLGATGGWIALMVYAMVLGLAMGWRWFSGRWRGLRL